MHQERIELVTRQRFEAWARKLDIEGATPSLVVGISQTTPGRVALCIDPGLSMPDLRRLLAYCLSELDAADAAAVRAPSSPAGFDQPAVSGDAR